MGLIPVVSIPRLSSSFLSSWTLIVDIAVLLSSDAIRTAVLPLRARILVSGKYIYRVEAVTDCRTIVYINPCEEPHT